MFVVIMVLLPMILLYTVNGHWKQVIEQCPQVVVLEIDSLIISSNKLKA
jgi:hypothetical protein